MRHLGKSHRCSASDDVSIDIAVQGTSSSTCRFRVSLVSWDGSNSRPVIDQDFLDAPGTSTLQPVDAGEYRGKAEVCTVTGTLRCGTPVFSSTSITKLGTADITDVIPDLTNDETFTLRWGPVADADRYEIRHKNARSATAGWLTIAEEPTVNEITLDIDQYLVEREASNFQVRGLRSPGDTNTVISGSRGIIITVINNPIYKIDGHSDPGAGTAVVSWNAVPDARGGRYVLRYQKMDGPADWQSSRNWDVQPSGNTFMELDEVLPALLTEDINWLNEGMEIYAVQLLYEAPFGRLDEAKFRPVIFSAQPSYFWPSDTAPSEGVRVGTFPSFGHWPSGVFRYRICEGTFSDQLDGSWADATREAAKQWEDAVPDLLTVQGTIGDCHQPHRRIEPDAYAELVDNEFNDVFARPQAWVSPLSVLRKNPGYICALTFAPACVISNRYWYPNVEAEDILQDGDVDIVANPRVLRNGKHTVADIPGYDTTVDPGEIRANECRDLDQNGDRRVGEDYFGFELMLHEVGHALGISQFYFRETWDTDDNVAHPTIRGSVMNYDDNVGVTEGDCFPYPMDIMAIRAIYEHFNR